MPVQLRFDTGLAGAEYVNRELWRSATLSHCPLHPRGGCGFARHGSYERKRPAGTRIARWYCPQGHCTFSLLPDHLAARFPGTLAEIEEVVLAAEQAHSLEACAHAQRPEPICLPAALRWVRRRVAAVRTLLSTAVAMLPQLLAGAALGVAAMRERLGVTSALTRLRQTLAQHLPAVAAPLGFRHRRRGGGAARGPSQQHMGPDPPA
jgi:predicted NBD/HSP70 family sugar kinase